VVSPVVSTPLATVSVPKSDRALPVMREAPVKVLLVPVIVKLCVLSGDVPLPRVRNQPPAVLVHEPLTRGALGLTALLTVALPVRLTGIVMRLVPVTNIRPARRRAGKVMDRAATDESKVRTPAASDEGPAD
jgi:hypothetical protein